MSVKAYRNIDLILLSVIGFVTELLAIFLLGTTMVFWMNPMYVVSIIVITLAITRWKQWGLLVALVQAVAVFIAGHFLLPNLYQDGKLYVVRSEVFNFYVLLVLIVSFISCLVSIPYVNKFTNNGSPKHFQLLLLLNIVMVLTVQTILLLVGYFVFGFNNLADLIATSFVTVLGNSLIGIFITYLLANFLNKQGLYIDQVYKLQMIEQTQKFDKSVEKKYYNGYSCDNKEQQETRKASEQ